MSLQKKLKSRKEIIFSDLSNLHDFFKDQRNKNFSVLKAKYQRVESLSRNYDELVAEIVEYNAEVEAKEEISLKDRDAFTELFDAIRSYYFRAERAEQEAQEVTDPTRVSVPSLPKIQLPQFDGTIENWIEFKTVFETLVHKNRHISEEEKFHYLKTNLRGEAAATISAFALEKENYQIAYKTLLKRYQSPRRLGNFYLQLILKFKSNGLNPQKFLNIHESSINALKALKIPDLTEFLLFQLSYNNLDPDTQQAFDLKFERNDITPTTADLLNYVRLLAKTDELKSDITSKHQFSLPKSRSHFSEIKSRARTVKNLSKFRCSYCHQEHFLAYCPDFKSKPWRDRTEFIQREKLCINCLGAHSVANCWSQKTCKVCQQKHHSLLHPMHEKHNTSAREDKISTHLSHQNRSVLLSTATIIIGSDQNYHRARALIDQGSESCFVSESLVQRLRLKRVASSAVVSGVGATTCAMARGCVRLDFTSRHKPETYFNAEALILPKLTDYLPPKIKDFPPPEFDQLILADEDIFSNQSIEVILGAEIYAQILQEGILRTCGNTILLQNTRLGWIFCGGLAGNKNPEVTVHCSTIDKNLMKNQRFWQMEEPKPISNQNDLDCEIKLSKNPDLSNLYHESKQESEYGPKQPNLRAPEVSEERKKGKLVICHSTILSDWIEKFSNYHRLLRVTAYCLRYINKLRKISTESGSLSVSEIMNAKKKLIQEVQQVAFETEIKLLKQKKLIPRSSCLIKLNPFLDDDGLLRVGGRLAHALLSHNQKHPIILPQKQFFSTSVVREAHNRTLHGGTQLTLSTIREEYWILGGRQAVKSAIKGCVTCNRFQGTTLYQQMGNLPQQRVQPSRPFLHAGVDYAGPLQLRTTKGRGHKSYKGYVAVFVCFFMLALHLEAVSDYTAEGFLAAYRRFSSRRGICASLTSDRGTNFVGAASLLTNLFDRKSTTGQTIANYFAKESTEWKFNPPSAPHFGGLWEAGVKSVKHHLKRVIGENTLTFEELSTLLCQIEAILNSRPLQPLSDDSEDFEALTPAHFLLGQPLTALPEAEPETSPTSIRSRWRLLQNQRQSFWRRWSAEYLQQLQRRNKWEYPERNIAVGDLVLVKQDNTSPCQWPLARVLQLHPGSDGLVRVVTLKTAKTASIQRPVVKICPLLPSVK